MHLLQVVFAKFMKFNLLNIKKKYLNYIQVWIFYTSTLAHSILAILLLYLAPFKPIIEPYINPYRINHCIYWHK